MSPRPWRVDSAHRLCGCGVLGASSGFFAALLPGEYLADSRPDAPASTL